MSRAQDLFDQLRKGGLAAVDQLILDREPESLFLDFKGSPDKGGPTLHKDDNKNISKAISGFGNAEGVTLFSVQKPQSSESTLNNYLR